MLLPFLIEGRVEAGIDEAGRGCIAGPVVAAAVIFPPDFRNEEINDSKKLSPKRREKLRILIESEAIAWCVAEASVEEIDKINILNASILAMHRAVAGLNVKADHLLVDGNRFKPFAGISHSTIVGGDARFLSIAAASILAKTHRDEMMLALAARHPAYDWEHNMGYPTAAHLKALTEHGLTPHHRRSYAPCRRILAGEESSEDLILHY